MTLQFIYVFLGGGTGSLVRYTMSLFLKKYYPSFPAGTLFVNILGSFLIGALVVFLDKKLYLKEFFLIGFLGGLTTFSSFSYESISLIKSERWVSFFLYFSANIFLGFSLAVIGYGWGSKLNVS